MAPQPRSRAAAPPDAKPKAAPPTKVLPPASLSKLRWFAVRYDREAGVFSLVVPDTRETFLLGGAVETRQYFTRVGLEHLGGRAMDSATAFGGSQALVAENRAWGMDLTDPRIDPVVGMMQKRMDYEEQLGGIDEEDEGKGIIL